MTSLADRSVSTVSLLARLRELAPGLLLSAGLAAAGFALRSLPGASAISPMMIAILLGVVLRNLFGARDGLRPGVAFATRPVLRFAIVLLGFQLTFSQAASVGVAGLAALALTLAATFGFTLWFGARLGVEPKLAQLIAAGTSICGASAVAATNSVTGAKQEDVAYAMACVTAFGSIAMALFPLVSAPLALDAHAYGLWAGASIHEVAQVIAAGFQNGREAGEFATVAKLSRVMMLAPVVTALGFYAARRAGSRAEAAAPIPWFAYGFIAMVGFNSILPAPLDVKAAIAMATTFLLTVALAAMGLDVDLARLRAKGLRPMLLAFAASLFVAGFGLLMVKAIG